MHRHSISMHSIRAARCFRTSTDFDLHRGQQETRTDRPCLLPRKRPMTCASSLQGQSFLRIGFMPTGFIPDRFYIGSIPPQRRKRIIWVLVMGSPDLCSANEKSKPLGRPRDSNVEESLLFRPTTDLQIPVVDEHRVEGGALRLVNRRRIGVVDAGKSLA